MMQMHIVFEFLLSWLVRVRNKDHLIPFMIAISMVCWINNVSQTLWDVLLFMRLVYSREWTKKWCLEMAKRQPKPNYPVSSRVYCEACDNNFVLLKRSIQRVGVTFRNVDMIQRVKYYPKAMAASEALPSFVRGWTPYVRPASFNSLFINFDPQLCMLEQTLIAASTRRVSSQGPGGAGFTARPRGQANMKSYCTTLRPYADTSASSGNHVER